MFGIILQIPFTSHEGTKYRINVYKQNFSGTTWVFDGGPEPIVTEEDNDDDPLKPIRSSTGYISFYVDPGSGEYADLDHIVDQILPGKDTDSPVKLEQRVYNLQTQQFEWNIVWQGFLQAAEYSSDWGDPSGVVQLPIISGLEALKSIEFDASETIGMVTIDELFGKVNEQTYELEGGFYKQLLDMGLEYDVAIDCPQELTIDGQNFVDWLNIEVMRYNFIEETDADNVGDPDYTKYTGAFYYDVMSEIMKMFGWCMYEDGQKITMVSRRWGADYAFSTADTYVLDLLTSDGTPSGSEKAVTYANADQKRDVMQGCRAVKLTADTNAISGTVLDVTTDGMVKENLSPSGTTTNAKEFETDQSGETYVHHGYYYCRLPKTAKVTRHFYTIDGTEMSQAEAEYNMRTGREMQQFARFEYSDDFKKPEEGDTSKTNYSYTSHVTTCGETGLQSHFPNWPHPSGAVNTDCAVVTIEGNETVYVSNGALALSFSLTSFYGLVSMSNDDLATLLGYKSSQGGNSALDVTFQLQIGDYYWDAVNNTWSTTASTFTPATDEGGQVHNTKTLSMPYNGASGYIMPVDRVLNGTMKLTIYAHNIAVVQQLPLGIKLYAYNILSALSNLKLSYYPLDNDINNDIEKENKYIAKCQAGSDDVEIELKLATKTQVNGPGYGLMMYDGDYLTNQFQIAGTARRPEEALLELAKQLRGSRREILTVNLLEHVKPQDRFIYNGKGYTLLSRTRNWASDESELKMYQVYSE